VRRRGFRIILDNLLTDGGEVFSLKRMPATRYSQEGSWYSFLLEADYMKIYGHFFADGARSSVVC
jgi:hypothetical protein